MYLVYLCICCIYILPHHSQMAALRQLMINKFQKHNIVKINKIQPTPKLTQQTLPTIKSMEWQIFWKCPPPKKTISRFTAFQRKAMVASWGKEFHNWGTITRRPFSGCLPVPLLWPAGLVRGSPWQNTKHGLGGYQQTLPETLVPNTLGLYRLKPLPWIGYLTCGSQHTK